MKANLDARATDPSVASLAWNLPVLRKQWNQAKQQVAPWWRDSSKEAYACGIADLVAALHNWSDAKHGRRSGAPVGFPRFKARRRDRGRVRFTTGAMRLEADRRHLVLPVIGRLRCKENTRRLERLLVKGRARVLSMTSQRAGAAAVRVGRHHRAPTPRHPSRARRRVAGSTWASGTDGRSSPTTTTPSSGSPIPPHGSSAPSSAAGSRGKRPAASSDPEDTARRKPSWRPWTGARPTSAREAIHILTTAWRAATAPSSSKTSTWPRWAGAWAASVPSHRLPGRHRPGPPDACLQDIAGGRAAGGGRPLVRPPPRPIMAAAATWPTSARQRRVAVAPAVGELVDRNANAASNLRDWTGPVAVASMATADVQRGGVAAPVPSWPPATTAGRLTHRVGVRGPRRPPRGGGGL